MFAVFGLNVAVRLQYRHNTNKVNLTNRACRPERILKNLYALSDSFVGSMFHEATLKGSTLSESSSSCLCSVVQNGRHISRLMLFRQYLLRQKSLSIGKVTGSREMSGGVVT